MTLFVKYYRITANISRDVKEFNQSYLLLSNHYGRYDPFIITYFINKRPNFVSSDAILRDWPVGAFFKGLGAIPKRKGVRDSHLIREMVKVINSGGSIALFPEATRTWSGETLYIDPSIAKLAKLLKVPVITARMKGAYNFDPRWAKSPRRSAMTIDYSMAISVEQLANHSSEEIFEIIKTNLYQDDISYQRVNKVKIRSNNRAEHLELILFICPVCEHFDTIYSKGNNVKCKECRFEVFVNKYGFFSGSSKPLRFDNPRDWLDWQNKKFVSYIYDQIANGNKNSIFYVNKVRIDSGIGSNKLQSRGIGKISFFLNRLVIETNSGVEELYHNNIDSLGPQFHERIELYHNDRAYRFTSTMNQEAGIKWELAINVVWARSGQHHKLSPYFKDLVLDNLNN